MRDRAGPWPRFASRPRRLRNTALFDAVNIVMPRGRWHISFAARAQF
jgi:hypothetical protein